jgi:hypothetical protein
MPLENYLDKIRGIVQDNCPLPISPLPNCLRQDDEDGAKLPSLSFDKQTDSSAVAATRAKLCDFSNKHKPLSVTMFLCTDDRNIVAQVLKHNNATTPHDLEQEQHGHAHAAILGDGDDNASDGGDGSDTVEVHLDLRYLMYPQDRSLMPQRVGGQPLVRSLGFRSQQTKRSVLLDVWEDWFTMASADAFVGTYSSNFGCVAYVLGNFFRWENVRITPNVTALPLAPMPSGSLDWGACDIFGLP